MRRQTATIRAAAAGLALSIAFGSPVAAQQEVISSRERMALFDRQVAVLDGRASQQYSSSDRLQPPRVEVPAQFGGPGYAGSYRGPYLDMARSAAVRHRVPEDLFLRLVQQESGWNPRALSRAGAQGLAQLMPATARYLGVGDAWDPYQNLDGGARYLREQFETFGSWRLALAAYNAGPDAVRQYGGVPPYRETRGYVKIILGE